MQESIKTIKSQDGKIEIPYSEIRNSCMCVTIYALLQYLLLFDEETTRKHTCYFTGYGVDETISRKLPGFHFDVRQTINKTFTPSRWLDKMHLRLVRNAKFPFLKDTEIYAQDLGFLSSLIGGQSYSMLADGPNFLTMNMQPDSAEFLRQEKKRHSLQGKAERILYGNVAVHTLGNNPQCKAFYLTEENISPVLKDKPTHINSFQELWQRSSESKKQFILDLFGVDGQDSQILEGRTTMFLTQPLVQDSVLTEGEYLSLLRRVFSHYDLSKMVIKTHPRDMFDYWKHFPDVAVYDKKINIQLMLLSGVDIQKAVTICSSSINAFPNEVEADWFGPNAHPAIEKFYGKMTPFRACNLMKL